MCMYMSVLRSIRADVDVHVHVHVHMCMCMLLSCSAARLLLFGREAVALDSKVVAAARLFLFGCEAVTLDRKVVAAEMDAYSAVRLCTAVRVAWRLRGLARP